MLMAKIRKDIGAANFLVLIIPIISLLYEVILVK